MHNLTKRLEKIGWEKQEIERAVQLISNAKKTTTEFKFLEKRVYWILLLVLVAANFAISVGLVPALMAIKGPFVYLIIAAMGISFGFLFELVIRGIEHLQAKHHIALAIFIPIVAAANFFVISSWAGLNLPMAASLAYAASFTAPYAFYRFVLKKEYYSA